MPGKKVTTRRPLAIVTGASSGIGEALARAIATEGFDLVLVARGADKLAALGAALNAETGARCTVLPCDLAVPGAPAALAGALKGRRVDLLVNNAGILEQGAFTKSAAARHQQLIDLNVSALTAMIAAFAPAMVRRGSGRILNVASIASFQPVPGLASYAATKAYALSLTESLAEELRPRGVTVTALCPGITATGMLADATAHNARLASLPGFVIGDAAEVAAAGLRACLAGDVICVPGVVNQAATLAARVAPKWLVRRFTGALGRRTI